ncbi:Hypothetical predicted protein [Cloeon dipterum]|uniref:Ionotropic glutamate receptor C-terminal domain-containing protein n=1 Tax=Cloeon dipterum TaxID=197152 RepID=A0A8S1C9P0_9INSE|nr:Hypothetical predicted protein [Cloeon dipterum]
MRIFRNKKDPPFVIIKNEGNKSSAEGWLVDVWNDLRSQLRFTFKFYQPSRRNANANRTKVSVQELSSGRAEVILTPAVPTLGNFHLAEFTYPVATLRLRFLIHRSSTVSGIGQFVHPFSPFLWYSVVGLTTFSALLMGTAYTLARRIGLETQEAPIFELRESFLIIFSTLLQQGTDSSPSSLSGRIILWCSYTFGVVIYTAYSAALISKLAVREVDFPFHSLDQMLASNYRPIVVRDSVLHYLIKEGETGNWKSLRERKPSVKLVGDVSEAIDELMRSNERLALLEAHERFGPLVQQSPHDCELLVMPGHELLPVTLMLQKSSPFKKAFDQLLLRMLETGRLSRARQRWLFLVDEDPCPLDSTLPSFALKHVTLPFLIFLAGIASSFLIFIIEILVHCAKRK